MSAEHSNSQSAEIAKLRRDAEKAEEDLKKALREEEQINHKIQLEENRMNYLKKKERAGRTHRLCVKGGVIESLVPGVTDFAEREFYNLMENIFSLPEVQNLVEERISCRVCRKEETDG